MPRQRSVGFTLLELLVVIAIIGVLVSLSLPAMQSAREAARRMNCQSNLKQLQLAIINYESSLQVYPAAGILADPTDLRSGKMISWIVLTLPYLEQQNLHQQFDFHVDVLHQPQEPQATMLAALLCPSDQARGQFYVDPNFTLGKRFAKGNYAAYCSPFHADLMHEAPGALVADRPHEHRDFIDGTSNTLVLSEVRVRANEQDQRGAWALPWTGSSLLAFDMHSATPGSGTYVHMPASLGQNQPPNNQGPNIDLLYNCTDLAGAQLAKMPCQSHALDGQYNYLSAAPRSQHVGGVLVTFMDGSVRFLSNNVDQVNMAYLVSINDGNVVAPP